MSQVLGSERIIELLDLEPLPEEGGMFRQAWKGDHGTAIYFLLRPGDFSAMHRLGGPEIWHYYAGAPATLVLLHPDGSVDKHVLGSDLLAGERPLLPVEPGVWMGAETTGEWTLLGTTMAPPYDPAGFELGRREALTAEYPAAATIIGRLTR